MTHAFDIFQERRLSVGKIDNNKQMKRESLLDSAFSLFIDNGFNKTSISDIGEQRRQLQRALSIFISKINTIFEII